MINHKLQLTSRGRSLATRQACRTVHEWNLEKAIHVFAAQESLISEARFENSVIAGVASHNLEAVCSVEPVHRE